MDALLELGDRLAWVEALRRARESNGDGRRSDDKRMPRDPS